MGTTPSVTNTFVANTKARSAQVNTNFTDMTNAINGGTHDLYTNAYKNRRLSNGSVTLTGSDCMFTGYLQIDSSTTYHLATSTARLISFGEIEIKPGGALTINSGAEARVL